MSDDFYIGYQKVMAMPLARYLRYRIVGLFLFAAFIAIVLVSFETPFAKSNFEFGKTSAFEGIISENPYPTLLVMRPDAQENFCSFSRYYLVGQGKKGAESETKGLDGKKVLVQGTLAYRDDQTMIEVVPDSIQLLENTEPVDTTLCKQELGTFTLRGEIVDSKCFLGVMKPGNLKPHRACAIRCISGGCPPVLVVRDTTGRAEYFMLVSSTGQTVNQDVLDKVAEPLEITGVVEKHHNMLLLKADPRTYRRLD